MMKIFNKSLLSSFILVIISTLFVSCGDDPTSIGNSLIPDGDRLNSKEIEVFPDSLSDSFISFKKDISFFGSSNRILLGKYENIVSEILISFTIEIPDSVEEHLKNNTGKVDSSWIEMEPNYWLGDSLGFGLSAKEIKTSWTSIYMNKEKIDEIKSSIGPNVLESLSYEPGDTVIKFGISNDLITNWVGVLFDESYPANYGILLSPSETTNGIAGFQALTSVKKDLYPLLKIVFKFDNGAIDTIAAIPKLDMHYITGERLIEAQNEVLLQDAIGIRGKLKFDLPVLPEGVIVNTAVLDLYYNENNSFEGSVKTDTVALSFYYDSESDSVNNAFGKYPLIKKNGKYSGEVKRFVQRWLLGEPNEGLEVYLSDGNRTASAISFYGSNYPNKELRPRITIYYTTK